MATDTQVAAAISAQAYQASQAAAVKESTSSGAQ
jgi:hypothetical protein